jgi:hypothetical protein
VARQLRIVLAALPRAFQHLKAQPRIPAGTAVLAIIDVW